MSLSHPSSLAWPHERDACGIGFIADLGGRKTHKTLVQALEALENLSHRGAVSADGKTGDGAGVLTQIPYKILRRDLEARGILLQRDEDLGVGVVFIDKSADEERGRRRIELGLQGLGLELLLWRRVPVEESALGRVAQKRRPSIWQVLLHRPEGLDDDAFERRLYLGRKALERMLRVGHLEGVYFPSFSHRTVVYKGMIVAPQLPVFYPDLADPAYETAFALFHQRYSTNTLPQWHLAQPFRYLAHNGEINTLTGNVSFMRCREPAFTSPLWGDQIKKLAPVVAPGGSDSAALDNALELLTLSGRDILHACLTLVPQAHEGNPDLAPELRAFYRYHASFMEPWDGPAALVFTDGRTVAAGLDRNGLRPQRYTVTAGGTVIVASEAGVVNLAGERIVEKGRLGPGTLLAVDTGCGEILRDGEIKDRLAARRPWGAWLETHSRTAPEETPEPHAAPPDPAQLLRSQTLFGYASEDLEHLLEPMALEGKIPVGSMGDDTPLAVLSHQPQLLYRYFQQRFAQVTNPPIDPLRERLVMTLHTVLGPRVSILEERPENGRVLRFASPLIGPAQLAWVEEQHDYRPHRLAACFPVAGGAEGLKEALHRLRDDAAAAVRAGSGILLLSDRIPDNERDGWAPIPMLLATSAVHHHLLEERLRTRTSLVLDTGEPREDHHFACLLGFGAALIHPYLAYDGVRHLAATRGLSPEPCLRRYRRTVEEGLLKILSKRGISTLSSYRGGQVFEIVGLDAGLVQRYFPFTPCHLGSATLTHLGRDALAFHRLAQSAPEALEDRGIYRYRKAGEYHAFEPPVFKKLHQAVRRASFEAYEAYAREVDERPPTAPRDLLEVRCAAEPLPLSAVEPAEAILRRFTTGAMSHGALSREAHEAVAVAMNRLGAKSNSGEGGEATERFHPYTEDRPDLSHAAWYPRAGDLGASAIKQVASGRFGVTPEYLVSAQEIEIKMAQGSKPGEGGQIPGHKVSAEIASIRRAVAGVTLISPPPHHDIYSIEDLAQLIYDLKRVHPEARVGVKLVATAGVGTIAAGVAKGFADNIQISGYDGGTGASPLGSVKHAGLPWELGLAETQRTLVRSRLRERVTLRVDGGMKTGRDVVLATLLGAEEYGFGTAVLVAAGCIMARRCHLNTCPVGVATQDPELRKKFPGTPEHVATYLTFVAEQVRRILAEMGCSRLEEIIGRTDLLTARELDLPRGAPDLTALLTGPDPSGRRPRRRLAERNERPEASPCLDERVWSDCCQAVYEGSTLRRAYRIRNRDRSVGARLAGEIARATGSTGLAEGSLELRFTGSAGQSFGAFNHRGMRLILDGEAQDYVGKGMFGGEIILRPPAELEDPDPVLLGNTVLYGATGGHLFAAGRLGERLAVRNSGAVAVVHGCGDHGCEYMTGGTVVVLGPAGRNFGAGMSGGTAYVYDPSGAFPERVNAAMVEAHPLPAGADEPQLRGLLERHLELTGSSRAARLLERWSEEVGAFFKITPRREAEDRKEASDREGTATPAPPWAPVAASRVDT